MVALRLGWAHVLTPPLGAGRFGQLVGAGMLARTRVSCWSSEHSVELLVVVHCRLSTGDGEQVTDGTTWGAGITQRVPRS